MTGRGGVRWVHANKSFHGLQTLCCVVEGGRTRVASGAVAVGDARVYAAAEPEPGDTAVRPVRAWWGSMWLAMALTLALAAPASAAVDAQALQAQQDASARLVALLGAADQAEGDQAVRLARLRTAEFASLIRVVSDEERLLGSEPVPLADLGRAFDTCNQTQRVAATMLLFDDDRPGKDIAVTDYEDPAVLAVFDRNTVVFQEELSVLQPFLFRCMAWLLPSVSEVAASVAPQDWTAEGREGMRMIRRGVVMMYTAPIPVLAAETLGDGYKRAILDSLVEHADVYAAASRLVDRKQVVDDLRRQRGRVPADYVAGIDRLIAAFSSTACTGLCAIE